MNQVKHLIKETKKYLKKYDYPKVIELCDNILDIEPESSFGLRFNAIANSKTGNYEKGLEYYNRLYELHPDEDTKYSIAIIYEKLGKYIEALELYDKNSKKKWIQKRRKRLLTKMKSYQTIIDEYDEKLKEIENLDKSVDNIKRMIAYLEEKAVFQYRNKKYNEALESFKKALTSYHGIESELSHYSKCRIEDWYKLLEEHIDSYPDTTDFYSEFFNYKNYADIWSDKIRADFSEYEDSTVFCDLLSEIYPDNIDLLSLCAIKYKYVLYDYSLDYWNKILEVDTENTNAIDEILEIYSYQYSKDKSLKLINQKLYIEDIRSRLLERKIRLLESMTLYDEAISAIDEYLSIDKKSESSYDRYTVLDKILCLEEKAIELYSDNQLDESLTVFGEVYRLFSESENSNEYYLSSSLKEWYNNILGDCLRLSKNNPMIFFEKFFGLNDRTVPYWEEKIRYLVSSNHFGNPITYSDILLDNNKNNIRILLSKAYVYYSTERLEDALCVYNRIIKLSDNNDAKNYKFNILVRHHQYMKAYRILKSMKIVYSIVNNYLYTLAEGLLKNRKYEESLYVYEKLFEETHRTDLINHIKYLQNRLGYAEKLENSPYYMTWIDLIICKYESDNCPVCGNELIPIVYGYPAPDTMDLAERDEIILGGCCITGDDPTHYCKCCKKELYMGTYKIDVKDDDETLAEYTRRNIQAITVYINEHPGSTIREIEKEAYDNGINHQEFTRFIEKLEEINHIKREKDTLIIIE